MTTAPSSTDAQPIPKITHQLWKTEDIPQRWRAAVESVERYHKNWEHRLWTDAAMDDHVRRHHPTFYPVFVGFERQIMRVDVFRYVLMHDIGGMYCDLDYEFLRPYDYGDADVVLSLERDVAYGDDKDFIGNFFFASVPKHAFWVDVLAELREHPPASKSVNDIGVLTGSGLLSEVFFRNRARYEGVRLTAQPVFSPRRVHGKYERKFYLNSGITYGFHHGWGTWRERLSFDYFRRKLGR